MRLLVTRPEADSVAFKAHLIAQGHHVVIDPLLIVRFDGAEPIELDGVQALIATSRNGLRALARNEAFATGKSMRVYCVGPGTASTAAALGFTDVVKGPATARDLVAVIARQADINGGPLLHLAGDVVTPGLVDELQRLGFHVLQPTVYRTDAAERLAAATVASLRNGRIDAIILLSPRTAEVYANLVQSHRLVDAVRNLTHVCVSAATAARLTSLEPAKVVVAAGPNLQEVLALLAPGATHSSR